MQFRKEVRSLSAIDRALIEARGLELINEATDELEVEVADVLKYQSIEASRQNMRAR
jgi:uncharacterized protein YaaN involved in tellurite resistance